MVFCWIVAVLQFSSRPLKVTYLSYAMCHVLSVTRKACKSLAFGSWVTSFSHVLPTSHMGYQAGEPMESVVYCLNNTVLLSSTVRMLKSSRIHESFIKYNVRKTVNPILFRLRPFWKCYFCLSLNKMRFTVFLTLYLKNLFEWSKFKADLNPGGYSLKWPIWIGYTRKGYHFRLQVYERVGISLVEVYDKIGKTVISVGKRAQKGLTDALHAWLWKELSKPSCFVIYSYFKDSTFTAVKRDAKF